MDPARAAVRSVIDRRGTGTAGRHGRLELTFEARNGRTMITHAYAEPPFRVGHAFEEGPGGLHLHLILASSAPGVFGGDVLEQIVRVGPGARVRLTSQSAMQLHPSPDGLPACVRSVYHIEDEGELSCHWDPLIPFAGSRLDQKIDVSLSAGGRLLWSDALMSGREARGERWAFASLAHELRLSRAGQLEYLERYRIDPERQRIERPWIAGEACYFGTALSSGWDVDPEAAGRLHAELGKSLRAAATALDRQLLLVRLTAGAGAPFHEARRRLLGMIRAAHERTGVDVKEAEIERNIF